MLMLFAVIVGGVVLFFVKLPASFLPGEDQGYLIVNVQLPPGATRNRTLEVMKQVEGYMLKQPEVSEHRQRAGLQFLGLRPERGAGLRAAQETGTIARARSIRRSPWPDARSARCPRCATRSSSR